MKVSGGIASKRHASRTSWSLNFGAGGPISVPGIRRRLNRGKVLDFRAGSCLRNQGGSRGRRPRSMGTGQLISCLHLSHRCSSRLLRASACYSCQVQSLCAATPTTMIEALRILGNNNLSSWSVVGLPTLFLPGGRQVSHAPCRVLLTSI